jgi:hypothetical protein
MRPFEPNPGSRSWTYVRIRGILHASTSAWFRRVAHEYATRVASFGRRSYRRPVRKSDVEILDEIIRTRGGFGHREHVELAWTYLRLHPIEEAEGAMIAAIRNIARRHGAIGKYHETITRAWLRFVAVHMHRWPADSFEQFVERSPDLLDRKLIEHFYSREVIFGEPARAAWVDPDLRRLPALAGA